MSLYFWQVPREVLLAQYPDLDWTQKEQRGMRWGLAVSCPLLTAAQRNALPLTPEARLRAVLCRSWNLMVQARHGWERVRYSRVVASSTTPKGVGIDPEFMPATVLPYVLEALKGKL